MDFGWQVAVFVMGPIKNDKFGVAYSCYVTVLKSQIYMLFPQVGSEICKFQHLGQDRECGKYLLNGFE